MVVTEMSILHHVGIVLLVIWWLSYLEKCHPIVYFFSFIYLYLIHERYVMRLRRKLQFEETKQANQRRILTDSETVRWLNYAVEKIWPICMEQIASQQILLPIIPWFLEKYKPWTARKAEVQHLYLGRNPPVFTEMRVLRHSTDDDHLVLELGMNFLTADDMSAILSVKLRKRLGFGMRTKLHLTGMHVEGKILVGVKFLRHWPFLGRVRVCFAEPPYFQMTVKPIFTHGLDVTEVPGIAGWLDKLLSIAFEQTLVEPNMLVVDMEKFVSPKAEPWFSVDVKEPIAYAKVEIIEASDMKPSDLNGLADPYVKGQLGPYRFRTKIQWKTLTPIWQEEFKIPICTWDTPNLLSIEVRDKDRFVDDTLGDCSVDINDLRDGQRHDMWLPLRKIKVGRLHLAVTVFEANDKGSDIALDGETLKKEDIHNSFANETDNKDSFSSGSSSKSQKIEDNFEPIDVKGQKETGIWIHHPGSEVSQTWEPRKGPRRLDTEIQGECNNSFGRFSSVSGPLNSEGSSYDDNGEGKKPLNIVRRGFRKIGSVFHRSPRKDDSFDLTGEAVQSPHANIKSTNSKEIGVKLVVEEGLAGPSSGELKKEGESSSPEKSGSESPRKVKEMAKSVFKHAEKSARSIKHVLSRKASRKSQGDSQPLAERDIIAESDFEDDSLSSPSDDVSIGNNECPPKEPIVQIEAVQSVPQVEYKEPTDTIKSAPPMNSEALTETVSSQSLEKTDNGVKISDNSADHMEGPTDPKLPVEKI